jgi:cytochrome b561
MSKPSYIAAELVRNPPRPYAPVAIALHWLLAVSLFGELALGWWMLEVPKTPPGLRAGWFNLHKSLGLCIALAVFALVAWRISHRVDDAAFLPRWQQRAARIGHLLLYGGMLGLPLSGYLGSAFSGYPVLFFGMRLPDWSRAWPAGKELMSTVHWTLAWLFVTLLVVHVGAALWHWFRRDGIPGRMGIPVL